MVCFTFPKNTLLGIMLETSLYCINIVYLYSHLQPLFEIETKISNLTLNHVFLFVFRLPLLRTNVKNAVDNVLLAELPKSPGFALSSELWSSQNNDSYQVITLHYIREDFQLRTFVIGTGPFAERHTADAIADTLDK